MKKVILKAALADREEFTDAVEHSGLALGPVFYQHDRVFVPKNYAYGRNFPKLIIRTEVHSSRKPAQYKLIFKRHIEDSGIDIVEETAVTDYAAAVAIAGQLGFVLRHEVAKQRQTVTEGHLTINYDRIEGEPTPYAKLEAPIGDRPAHEVREELEEVFGGLASGGIIKRMYKEEKEI